MQAKLKKTITWPTTAGALQRCYQEKVFWKYPANLQENTHAESDFNEAALQLYWIHTSLWVFSCEFAT